MSYLSIRGAYAIVTTTDLTENMLNMSREHFNVTGDISSNSLRKTSDGTKTLVRFKDLNTTVLISYRWYSYEEILIEMEKAAWQ